MFAGLIVDGDAADPIGRELVIAGAGVDLNLAAVLRAGLIAADAGIGCAQEAAERPVDCRRRAAPGEAAASCLSPENRLPPLTAWVKSPCATWASWISTCRVVGLEPAQAAKRAAIAARIVAAAASAASGRDHRTAAGVLAEQGPDLSPNIIGKIGCRCHAGGAMHHVMRGLAEILDRGIGQVRLSQSRHHRECYGDRMAGDVHAGGTRRTPHKRNAGLRSDC